MHVWGRDDEKFFEGETDGGCRIALTITTDSVEMALFVQTVGDKFCSHYFPNVNFVKLMIEFRC